MTIPMGRFTALLVLVAAVAAGQADRNDFERFLSASEADAAQRVEPLLRAADADLARWARERVATVAPGAHLHRHPGDGPDALVILPIGVAFPRTCLISPTAPRGLDAFELRAAGAPFLAAGHALVAPMRRVASGPIDIDAGWIVGVERALGLSHEGRVAVLGTPWSELALKSLDVFGHAIGAFHVGLLGEASGFDTSAAAPLRHQHWVFEHGTALHPDTVRALRAFATDAAFYGVVRESFVDPTFDLRPSSAFRKASRSSELAARRPSTSPFKLDAKSAWLPIGRTGVIARARTDGTSIVVEHPPDGSTTLRVDNLLPGDAIEVRIADLAVDRSPLEPPASFDLATLPAASPRIPEHLRLERDPPNPRRDALFAFRMSLHLGWKAASVRHLRVLN